MGVSPQLPLSRVHPRLCRCERAGTGITLVALIEGSGVRHGRRNSASDSSAADLQHRESEGVLCRLLGFTIDWEHRFDDNAPLYMQVSKGRCVLHLTEHRGDCCPGSTVFVWLTGIEDLHRDLTAKQYRYMRPGLERTGYGSLCVSVIDPFGNCIRFNEKAKAG
jgi:hypothetical protein